LGAGALVVILAEILIIIGTAANAPCAAQRGVEAMFGMAVYVKSVAL
jgi:hypothetical protein